MLSILNMENWYFYSPGPWEGYQELCDPYFNVFHSASQQSKSKTTHFLLIAKLAKSCIDLSSFRLIQRYRSYRFHSYKTSSDSSEWLKLVLGVPQGILGPKKYFSIRCYHISPQKRVRMFLRGIIYKYFECGSNICCSMLSSAKLEISTSTINEN